MSTKQKKESQIDSLLEKSHQLIEKLNNFNTNTDPVKEMNFLSSSSLKNKPDLNYYDSISNIDLLKYSLNKFQESQSQKEEQMEEQKNAEEIKEDALASQSLSYSNTSHSVLDIKKYQNLILKFNKLSFLDAKNDALNSVLYFECKIPLFKGQNDELFYDTFKVHIQNQPQGNVVQLNQLSYHKLNLESDSFSALTNSAITITLYKINPKTNIDAIVGSCILDFNQVICSKEFNYSGALDIIFIKDQNRASEKKTQGRKQKDIKAKQIKVGKLELTCLLQKDKKKNPNDIYDQEEEQDDHDYHQQQQLNPFESGNRNPKESSSSYPNSNQHHQHQHKNPNQILISSTQEEINEVQEIKTDMFDEILVIYLNISKMNIANNSASIIASYKNKGQSGEFGFDSLKRNYFIMHKIFPDMNLACSDIMWDTAKPNFNYSIQMPFTLNQSNAELLDNGVFVLELWNKGIEDDELVGVVKFELREFLDALKVDDTTISTQQLTKNTFPMVLYDNFYPINAYDTVNETGSIFLKILMAIGSPIQINNFITKLHRERVNEEIDIKNKQQQFASMSKSQQENIDIKSSDKGNCNKRLSDNKPKPKQSKEEEDDCNDRNSDKFDEDNRLDPFKVPDKKENKKKKDKDKEDKDHSKHSNLDYMNNSQQENSRREYINHSKHEDNNNRFYQSRDEKERENLLNYRNSCKALEINVEEMFEKNKRDMQQLNEKYELLANNTFKQSANSTFDANKKDVINPFIVPNETFQDMSKREQHQKPKENIQDNFKMSKGHNFDIFNQDKDRDNKIDQNQLKSSQSQISQIRSQEDDNNSIPKKSFPNPLNNNTDPRKNVHTDNNSIKNIPINTNDEELKLSSSNIKSEPSPFIHNALAIDKTEILVNSFTKIQDTDLTKKQSTENNKINNMHIIKHIFDIQIDKLFNVQILSKIKGAYIKYKFFTDQHPLRSETLLYSSYNLDASTIDVDMKSTHTIILSAQDKLKEYLTDFVIELMYTDSSNKPIIIGKVNIPVEEFYYLITDTFSITRMLFIYGTEYIKRNECIIGKVKLGIKYSNEIEENNGNDIFIEKQTIYNRKIPKNCNFKLTSVSFNHFSQFEEYYNKDFSYYFIISPFAELTKLEKTLGKRYTSKKYNLLSSEINETVVYKLNIDQEIIDYFKCRNCYVYLVYKSYGKRLANSINSDSELDNVDLGSSKIEGGNEKRIIGKGVLTLNDVLTSTDPFVKSILIKQIDNASNCLGELTMRLLLENSNDSSHQENQMNSLYQTAKLKQYLVSSRDNSNLYLNGKFLFAIRFDRIIHQLTNLFGEFYFMFKLGKNLKKVSPKFSIDDSNNNTNEDIVHLSSNTSIILLNYNELFELDLNFSKKLPHDLYTQFNEGVLEIKMFNGDDSPLGNFYIDLSKLIRSDFYSDNILFSGENIIKLTELKSNNTKELKLQIDFCLIKMDEEINNADYYQSLFSYETFKSLLSINSSLASDANYIKGLLQINSIDFYSFINENIISLNDIRGNFILEEFKKIFYLITKLNFDIFAYYQTNNQQLAQCDIESVLDNEFNIINIDNNDINILNYIKCQKDVIAIAIAHNNNQLTSNINKAKLAFDRLDYCLWITGYQFNLLPKRIENFDCNTSVGNPVSAFKKLIITIYSGMNITKCNSELNDRPNAFFILNFDDKAYKSEVIMKSSHPSWNEELEIKIPYNDYENKINGMPLVISIYSQENEAELIGKVEIDMSKLFSFLNIDNECEDFYHISNNGIVQGQLNIKIKFDELNNLSQIQMQSNMNKSLLMNTNQRITNNKNSIYNKQGYSSSNVFQNDNIHNNRGRNEEVDTETLRMKLEDAMNSVSNLKYELCNPLIDKDYKKKDDDKMLFNDIQNEFNKNPQNDYGNLSQYYYDNNNNNNEDLSENKKLNISIHSSANEREKNVLKNQRPPLMNQMYKNANRNLINHIEKIMKGNKN